MAKLTKEEAAWVKKLNKLIAQCPSERIGFYTIGDPCIGLYDATHQDEINDYKGDLLVIAQANDWLFDGQIDFPRPVDGVCG